MNNSPSWELWRLWTSVIIPCFLDHITLKWAISMPTMEKGWSMMALSGFQKIVRPLAAPFEYVWMELQVFQQHWKMSSTSSLVHFLSYKRRMYGFSTWMLSWRVLCFHLPLSHVIFQVIIFIMTSWGWIEVPFCESLDLLELSMQLPTSLMSCADLQPRCFLSWEAHLNSEAGYEDIPNLEVDLAVESMKNLCNFLSCYTGIVCKYFMLKASFSFSISISTRSCSFSCIRVSPPFSSLSSFCWDVGLVSCCCSLVESV